MTKAEFLKQLRGDIDKFSVFIDDCNKKYPEVPIEDLSDANWFEQFMMFAEELERS